MGQPKPKVDPSLVGMLGRYKYVGGTSDKFWQITFNRRHGTYDTEWGRNGYPAQGNKDGLTGTEALKKIREKLKKGYTLASGDEQVMAAKRVTAKRAKRKKVMEDAFDFVKELKKL